MSEKEIEDLKKQLKEARAREENERREKEEAKTREENERREKETERRENRKTTLAEYLYNCHFDLYQKLRLAGPSESSTGLATSVDGKYYPRWLRPWHAFTDSQRQEHFDDIIRICGERRLFQQRSTTRDNGINFERKNAGYENAIDHFEKTAVEDPTWMILEPVWADRAMCQKYQVTNLTFMNGVRNFKDLDEDIGAEVKTGRGKQQPDGGGIRTGIDGNESAAFMYDYKAAHKFAVEYLEAALEKETLFTDVYKWVQTDQYKTDSTLRKEEREAARIAMALIQVFNYMLWRGVPYGRGAAGKSLSFPSERSAHILGQQFTDYIFPYESIGLSAKCLDAVNITVAACPSSLVENTGLSASSFELMDATSLKALCESTCQDDLSKLRKSIYSSCTASQDVMVPPPGNIAYPATFVVDRLLFAAGISCLKDSASDNYCDLIAAQQRNQTGPPTKNQNCSECAIAVQAKQLESPFGYNSDAASDFASTTASCAANIYSYATPTSYALNSTSGGVPPPALAQTSRQFFALESSSFSAALVASSKSGGGVVPFEIEPSLSSMLWE